MIKVTTATGKEFLSDYLVTMPSPKMLYVRILESDPQTVRDVFSDPNETSVLTYGGNEYTGYTMLRSVFDEGDALKVGLDYAINNNT